MNETTTEERFCNCAIQIIVILALASAGVTLFRGHLRGNRLVTSTGRFVYVQERSRIGIPVTFMNDGPGPAVINSSSLTLYDDWNTFQFDLKLVTPPAEDWNDEGGKIKPPLLSNPWDSPVTIKAGDAVEGVFWYLPRLADFKLRANTNYGANLSFFGTADEAVKTDSSAPTTALESCSAIVLFHIYELTAENAAQNEGITISVPTGWPTRP